MEKITIQDIKDMIKTLKELERLSALEFDLPLEDYQNNLLEKLIKIKNQLNQNK